VSPHGARLLDARRPGAGVVERAREILALVELDGKAAEPAATSATACSAT